MQDRSDPKKGVSERHAPASEEEFSPYPVGNRAAHRRDHGNGATTAMLDHLLRYGLSCHEDSGDLFGAISTDMIQNLSWKRSYIHLEHRVRVLGRILQRRCLLLNTSRRNQAIKLPLRLANTSNDLIQLWNITHINLSVVQRSSYSQCQQKLRTYTQHNATYQAPQLLSSAHDRSLDLVLAACPMHTQ